MLISILNEKITKNKSTQYLGCINRLKYFKTLPKKVPANSTQESKKKTVSRIEIFNFILEKVQTFSFNCQYYKKRNF